MAMIDTYLAQIRTAVYGREVRSAIAGGIEECYNYVNKIDEDVSNSALKGYVTKEDLEAYLLSSDASDTYATIEDLADYLQTDDADTKYIQKSDLEATVKDVDLSDKYVLKKDLSNYLKSTEIERLYATKNDLDNYAKTDDLAPFVTAEYLDSNFVTKQSVEDFVTLSQIESFVTIPYLQEEYIRRDDLSSYHSFDYVICGDESSFIPKDVANNKGTVGNMMPGENTLWKIYLVPVNDDEIDSYDEYITIKIDQTTFKWEKIGGRSSGTDDGGSGNDTDIDLSNYVTYDALEDEYASKNYLTNYYLTTSNAEQTYLTKEQYDSDMSDIRGTDGLATKADLKVFLTTADAADIYAEKVDLQKYLKAADAEDLYVTKQYVDTMVVTTPKGDNIILMLEVDDIPGATQTIYYADDGSIDRIIHVKDGVNYRVDSFQFRDDQIIETRVLTTGHTLKITINTDSLQTVTEYTAP